MPNLTYTAVDTLQILLAGGHFEDEQLTLGAAVTVKAGTILARDSSTGKLVPFVIGGVTNDNGIPKAVLTYQLISVGATDYPVRAMQTGTVRFEKLVVQADGDNSNIDAPILDALRDYGIIAVTSADASVLDNA